MWLLEPGAPVRRPWLFKSVTLQPEYIYGEDWAEKTAAELAERLGIPCAHVEMARRDDHRGSISADLRPAECQMQHGTLLCEQDRRSGNPRGGFKGYTTHNCAMP